jgi:hypothetical protein
MILQQHKYDPQNNQHYWEISFVQFSTVSLTIEEYHEAAHKLEKIIEEIEARRMALDSNNQHNK